MAVISRTRTVAENMRAGISHLGGERGAECGVRRGIRRNEVAMTTSTKGKLINDGTLMLSSMKVHATQTQKPATTLGNQNVRVAKRVYAKEKTETEIIPIIIACEAVAAKMFPCSSARKNATGPEVRGSPMSQPLIVGPQ